MPKYVFLLWIYYNTQELIKISCAFDVRPVGVVGSMAEVSPFLLGYTPECKDGTITPIYAILKGLNVENDGLKLDEFYFVYVYVKYNETLYCGCGRDLEELSEGFSSRFTAYPGLPTRLTGTLMGMGISQLDITDLRRSMIIPTGVDVSYSHLRRTLATIIVDFF